MVYLMMDKHGSTNLVKVGRASHIPQRRASYRTHNPLAIMRSNCAGTSSAEFKCHEILNQVGKRIPRTEWWIVSDEIFAQLYKEGMGYFFPKHQPIHFCEEF